MSEKPSILPASMRFEGSVECDADFVVLGTLVGDVVVDGALVVEEGGTLIGPARARTIVIRGTLRGDATAREIVRIEASARLEGDAIAPKVQVQEGARIRGRIEPVQDGAPRVVRPKRAKAVRPATVVKVPEKASVDRSEWSNPGTLPPPAVPAEVPTEAKRKAATSKKPLTRAEPTLVGAPVAELLAEATPERARRRTPAPPIEIPEPEPAFVEPTETKPVVVAPAVVVSPPAVVVAPPPPAPVVHAPAPAPVPQRRRPPVPRIPAIRRVEAKRREGRDES